jgi:hypothetical protein
MHCKNRCNKPKAANGLPFNFNWAAQKVKFEAIMARLKEKAGRIAVEEHKKAVANGDAKHRQRVRPGVCLNTSSSSSIHWV